MSAVRLQRRVVPTSCQPTARPLLRRSSPVGRGHEAACCRSHDFCNATSHQHFQALECCISLRHNGSMIYGYARVSTDGQTLVAQWEQLRAAGAEKVFEEKASGAKSDRQQLGRLLRAVRTGDVLLVTRLDRLARSTRDLLNVLAGIADRGAAFRSLADHWADTTTPHGRLTLAVLGGLAEFERELIRARTSEGRARAKRAGRSLGRPFKLTLHQQAEALKRKLAGESVREIAKTYAVSASTISRLQ